ncbi:hypothetical protein FRC01_006554, partial [Tulasnella sp. 417]
VERPQFRPRSSSEVSTKERLSFQEGVASPPRQKTPPPPVPPVPPLPPPLPNGAATHTPPPQRIPSPEVDRGFYSSADVYSHGRLPLEPPWSRPDPLPKFKPIGTPREEKRILVRLDDDPRTSTPSSDGKTASTSTSPTSDSPTEPQKPLAKRRNTLKKKMFSRRKQEPVML